MTSKASPTVDLLESSIFEAELIEEFPELKRILDQKVKEK
jgi:hypothetical protein